MEYRRFSIQIMAQNLALWNFQQFAKQYQFRHVTSSPIFFQTNGLVKRTLQTVKKLVKKVYKENKDPYLAILELWNIQNPGVGLSPTQLHNRHQLAKANGLRPKWSSQSVWRKTATSEEVYWSKLQVPWTIKPGDGMRVRQGGTWEPAMQLGNPKVVKELYIHKVGFLSAIPDRNRIR